jgi:O-antigen ligase
MGIRALNVPLNDISPQTVPATPTVNRSEIIFSTLETSLVVMLCAMTWAIPLSAQLAINLFRVSVVLWVVLACRPGRTWPSSPVFLPLICFFAVTALASVVSLDPTASWQQMKSIELAFAAVMISDGVRSHRLLRWLLGGLLVTSFSVAVFAGWQYIHRAEEFERVQGLYKHYVNFGETLLLVAALAFGIALANGRGSRVVRVGSAIAFVALTAALAATATRTFLAALILACAYMVWQQFRWKARAIAAIVLVFALIAGGWWLHSRRGFNWFDLRDPGTQYRVLIWRDAAHIVRQHPLLGVGLASVQRHPEQFNMSAYRAFPNMISHFHSTPIEIAADCGLPTLIIWLWLMWACWSIARRAFTRAALHDPLARGLALGVLGAILAFQFASLFHYILGDPEPMLIFWVLIGSAVIFGDTGPDASLE